MIRYGLKYKLLNKISDHRGTYIILKVEIQGSPIALENFHALTTQSDQVEVFQDLVDQVQSLSITDRTRILFFFGGRGGS